MIGALLRYALLFLLPFVLYGAWVAVARRRAQSHPPGWQDWPLLSLTGAGVALMLVGMFTAAFLQGEERGGVYDPARIEAGQIVPGEVRGP